MNCCAFTNQALEQVIPQIHVCLAGMILNGAENENNWYNFDRLIDLQTAFDT